MNLYVNILIFFQSQEGQSKISSFFNKSTTTKIKSNEDNDKFSRQSSSAVFISHKEKKSQQILAEESDESIDSDIDIIENTPETGKLPSVNLIKNYDSNDDDIIPATPCEVISNKSISFLKSDQMFNSKKNLSSLKSKNNSTGNVNIKASFAKLKYKNTLHKNNSSFNSSFENKNKTTITASHKRAAETKTGVSPEPKRCDVDDKVKFDFSPEICRSNLLKKFDESMDKNISINN